MCIQMSIYLCYKDELPIIAYSSLDDAMVHYDEVKKFPDNHEACIAACGQEIFSNKLDAILYAERHDINSVYLCHVLRHPEDDFVDPDVIDLTALFTAPVQYIGGLDISYQIYNGMDPAASFREAVQMFNLLVSSDIELINQLIEYDPNMKIRLEPNREQFMILAANTFTTMSDLIRHFQEHYR